MRWNRLERLIAAISEQASESSEGLPNAEENKQNPLGWKYVDMYAVVSATEDLLEFILSKKGQRVRVFLLRDVVEAADAFLDDKVIDCKLNGRINARQSEEHGMVKRVIVGFRSLCEAVKLAPEVWTAMFLRFAVRPEVHAFAIDIVSALMIHLSRRLSEASWICISGFLYELTKQDSSVQL